MNDHTMQCLRPDPVLDGVLGVIDPSWRSELRHLPLIERLLDEPRALPGLRRHFCGRVGATTVQGLRVPGALGELLTRPAVETVALVRAVGAVLWWPAARKAVAGPELRAIVNDLGQPLFQLVLHRGEALAAGRRPVARALRESQNRLTQASALCAGTALFIDALDAIDESARRLLAMRLPRAWCAACRGDRGTYPPEAARAIADSVWAALREPASQRARS